MSVPVKQMLILLRLYRAKRGSILDICRQAGIERGIGTIYKIKPMLVSYGVFVPVTDINFNGGLKTVCYKVDHGELDRLLITETEIECMYDERIRPGKVSTLFKPKPKEINNVPKP